MRLFFPSLILIAYIVVSLIARMPCRLPVKIAVSLAFLLISMKYPFYVKVGGSFIAPAFPYWVLLIWEALYAALVILFFFLLIKDSLALLLWAGRFMGTTWHLPFSPAVRSAGLIVSAITLGIFGTWQSLRVPDVRTVEIHLPEMPMALNGFSIVQLTDIHIGPFLKRKWLRQVTEKANALTPDLIALTGDMIDGDTAELMDDVAPLGDLRARFGVFGVTGNHEYYFNVEKWLPVFKKLGIVMLHNEHKTLTVADGAELVIAGVPDQKARRFGGPGPDIQKALAGAPDATRVLLAHRPNGLPGNIKADIQLSGHTHGGHLFFLKWLISAFNGGLVNGLYEKNGMKLYVSPGTGIWAGFSCRLGVPSEITRIVLRAQAPQ